MERPEARLIREDWDDQHGLIEPDAGPEVLDLEEGDDLRAARWSLVMGWRVLRHEWSAVTWVAAFELLGSVLGMVPWVILLGMLAVKLQTLELGSAEQTLASLLGLFRWALSPQMVLGSVGMVLVAKAVAWALGHVAGSGVLGALSQRVTAEEPPPQKLFWSNVGTRYLRLLVWDGLRLMVMAGSVFLSGGALLLLWRALDGWHQMPGALLAAVLLGLLALLGASFMFLVASVFQVALGWLFLEERDGVGVSLYEGARLLGERPREVMAHVGLTLLPTIVVWSIYLPFYAVSVWMSQEPQMALAATLLQALLDVLFVVAMALVMVWTRGATLGYVAMRRGSVLVLPPKTIPNAVQTSEGNPTPKPQTAQPHTPGSQLHDILPKEYPHLTPLHRLGRP